MARVRLRRALDRGGARWKNVASTEDYVRRIGLGQPVAVERRELGRRFAWKRRLFTGLRLNEGLDLERIGARYDIDVWAKYGGALQPFVDAGLVVHSSRYPPAHA